MLQAHSHDSSRHAAKNSEKNDDENSNNRVIKLIKAQAQRRDDDEISVQQI